MKKICYLIIIILFALTGCSEINNSSNGIGDLKTYSLNDYGDYVYFKDQGKNADLLSREYNDLKKVVVKKKNDFFESKYEQGLLDFFNIDNKIKINIDISKTELEKMNNDYIINNKETYRICNLEIEMNGLIFHYNEVGIRQKGNTSRGLILEGDGKINLRHYKLSFSETFDDEYTNSPMLWTDQDSKEYRKNRTFFGLEKMNIRWNRNYDNAYIREYYAYEMYRNNQVLAPYSNPCNVLMNIDGNEQNLGVYLVCEDINKEFIKRNLVDSALNGDLYKCGWSYVGARFDSLDSSLFGVEDQTLVNGYYQLNTYPYDLKTNKKTSNHELMKGFISELINTRVNDFDDLFKNKTYYESVINYLAVSYLLGDPDDLRGDFNNTYVYFMGNTNQLVFIPTDNDRALGSSGGSNPTNHFGALNKPFDSNTGYIGVNTSPLFTKSIFDGGNKNIKTDYIEKIGNIVENGWMSLDKFKGYYQKMYNNYLNDLILGDMIVGNVIPFSLEGNTNLENGDNLKIEVYFNTKVNTFKSFKFNPDEIIEYEYSNYYFRGEVNDWNGINNEYCLKIIDNVPTLDIYLDSNKRFKIANSDWSIDYDYSFVIQQDKFESAGNHNNIRALKSGYYRITIIDDKLSIVEIE